MSDEPKPELPDFDSEQDGASWWLYFDSESKARLAADALEVYDCLTLIEPSRAPHRTEAWQLRAAKPVSAADLDATTNEIKAISKRFHGHYDGHDSGWLDISQLPRLLAGTDVSVDDIATSLECKLLESHDSSGPEL